MQITVKELAAKLSLTFTGDGAHVVSGVNTLENATTSQVSFLANPKYVDQLKVTQAGVVVLESKHSDDVATALVSTQPYLDFIRIVQLFAVEQGSFEGQSTLAFIHPEADVSEDATIYPFVYVGAKATVGSGTKLFAGVYVGEDCRIGASCTLYPNSVLMAGTVLGDNVVVHPGVVLGSDGFGYAQGGQGIEKFPQVGTVVVGDNVDIGANSTIDRAALGITSIGKNSKLDNLVQLGHNVTIGDNCIVVSQVGIAGSTSIGNNVILAGQVGIAGHLTIGDNVRIGAKSGVGRSIPSGTDVSGIPAMGHKQFLKTAISMPRLPELIKRMKKLEKELAELKNTKGGDDV